MIREYYGGKVMTSIDVRTEVAEFAEAMEQKLRKNDHKTGWKDQPIEAHIKLLRIEMMELDVALDHLGDKEAMNECVDIANFAMIIRDKLMARLAAEPPIELWPRSSVSHEVSSGLDAAITDELNHPPKDIMS